MGVERKDSNGIVLKEGYEVCINFDNEIIGSTPEYWNQLREAETTTFYPESGTSKPSKPKELVIGEVISLDISTISPLVKVKIKESHYLIYSFDLLVMP